MKRISIVLSVLLAIACIAQAAEEDESKTSDGPPKVGDTAPDFALKGSDGKTYKLSEFKGKQPVIVAWFPKAFTGGWTKECISLRESGKALKEFGVAHFAASCDTVKDNTAFAKKLELDYAILSDPEKKVAKAYGILSPRGFSNRVTFIIDAEGKIAYIDGKVKTASHGKDLVDKLKELKIKPVEKRENA